MPHTFQMMQRHPRYGDGNCRLLPIAVYLRRRCPPLLLMCALPLSGESGEISQASSVIPWIILDLRCRVPISFYRPRWHGGGGGWKREARRCILPTAKQNPLWEPQYPVAAINNYVCKQQFKLWVGTFRRFLYVVAFVLEIFGCL